MARVKLNDTERTAFKEVYKYECYICEKKKEPNELEIDHIIPPNKQEEAITMGVIDEKFDIDSYHNYAPICRPCNQNKSDMLASTPRRVILFLEIAEKKLPKVECKVKKSQKQYTENQAILFLNKLDKSGILNNPRVREVYLNIFKKYTECEVNNITLVANSPLEIIGNKVLKSNELDNFITKIQTSQEIVFGYSNTSYLVLEEGIEFYPLSIYQSHRRLYNREFFTQNQKELIFELNFYAILLKDNKAVLISIPNVNVGFKNIDYKEEIESGDQLSLFNIDSPFNEKNTRQRYFYSASFFIKIRRKLMELTNASRIIMQYIRELFKDVNE
jgi:hypothetical protein